MIMKRLLWIRSLAVMLAALACLCGSVPLPVCAEDAALNAADDYEAKKAAYRAELMADDVTTDDLLIGSWVSFYSFRTDSYEEQLDQMAAAGINFNIFPRDFGGGRMFSAGYWRNVEKQYAERNMVYLMNGSLDAGQVAIGAEYAEGKAHCVGYHVVDEPAGDALEAVADQVRLYREADGTRYPFVNLLPSYAGRTVLGGSYREHVSRFVELAGAENIEYLSHDFYVFEESRDNTDVYADLEVMRSVAFENGKMKTHAFPQSTSWSGMRMPNIDEMRWNVYLYLAYGFKALTWFNMVCPVGFDESVISRNGAIRDPELFAAWGELNWEARGLSSVLMNLDTAHAYHTGVNQGGVERLPKDYFLQPKGAAAKQFIISCMEQKEGEDEYIMLFNKNYRKSEMTATFLVDAGSDVKWLEYFDPFIGEYIPVEFTDGQLTETFRAGEGKLYRLRRDDPPAETEAPTDAPADAPEGKGGCGSVVGVGTTAAIATVTAAMAAALALRKNKNERA